MKETRLRRANGVTDPCYKGNLKHGCWLIMRENSKVSLSLLNRENLK